MTPSSMTTASSDPNAYAQQYYNTFGYVPAKASVP
jgi:hypothetical protein